MKLDLELGKSSQLNPFACLSAINGALLHSRLVHPSHCPFSKAFPGSNAPSPSDPCIMLKHHWLPYKGQFKVAEERLKLINSDLRGIINPPSLGGCRYYSKITDSCSSWKFVYLLQTKSQTFQSFLKFKNLIENRTSSKIKAMFDDNIQEYTSSLSSNHFSKNMVLGCTWRHLTRPRKIQWRKLAIEQLPRNSGPSFNMLVCPPHSGNNPLPQPYISKTTLYCLSVISHSLHALEWSSSILWSSPRVRLSQKNSCWSQ